MIIAVIAVRMVQPAVHKIVHVVPMRHGFVSAAWAMLVRAVRFRRAAHRICRADLDDMFIDLIAVHVLQMAILQIIDMAIMANRQMSAVRAMQVRVAWMMVLGRDRHGDVSFQLSQITAAWHRGLPSIKERPRL
jgi:hypothetical protein